MSVPRTPDGRYIVVRGRLWRASNPHLPAAQRESLVKQLMDARRRVRSLDPDARAEARRDVDRAKHALGERGEAWWSDGTPDYNRFLVKNTPYANWFSALMATADP